MNKTRCFIPDLGYTQILRKKLQSLYKTMLWVIKIKYWQTRPLSPLSLFLAEHKFIELDRQDKKSEIFCWSGDTRIWTGDKGFAVPRLTTWPCRQIRSKMDKKNIIYILLLTLSFFLSWIPLYLSFLKKKFLFFIGSGSSLYYSFRLIVSQNIHRLKTSLPFFFYWEQEKYISGHRPKNSG